MSFEYHENELLMETRPVFVLAPKLLTALPMVIFFTIWGAGFCGGFGMFAVQGLAQMGVPFMGLVPPWFTFVFFGLVFFLGTLLSPPIFEKKTYERTRYVFYPDEIIYYEGFWNIEEKTISYKNIIEVSLQKGIFQQKYGLGTVKLSTAAHIDTTAGIFIKDIPDAENVYRFLKEQIKKAKEEAIQ